MKRNGAACSQDFHFSFALDGKILKVFAGQTTGHSEPSLDPLKLQAGASALNPEPPRLPLWVPQPTFETPDRLLHGKQPRSGYNEPAQFAHEAKDLPLPGGIS